MLPVTRSSLQEDIIKAAECVRGWVKNVYDQIAVQKFEYLNIYVHFWVVELVQLPVQPMGTIH